MRTLHVALDSNSLLKKRLSLRRIRRTKGRFNSKLHAACDGQPVSAFKGPDVLLAGTPDSREGAIGDPGNDSKRVRQAFMEKYHRLHSAEEE
ncbi:hypothetical protein AD930_09200 [Acetobacter malorum]|nr:hypothetical protein AD930_09200 [Acetobacter malorum]